MATIQDDVVRLEKASGSRKLITTDCVYDLTEDKTQEAVNAGLEAKIGIVVDGKSCTLGASQGQYIILRNSDISGKDDGLYTAAQPISAGETNVTAAMLSNKISNGAANVLKDSIDDTYLKSAICFSTIIPTGTTNEVATYATAVGVRNGVWKCRLATNIKGNTSLWPIGSTFTVNNHIIAQRLTLTNTDAYYYVNTLCSGVCHAALDLQWQRDS